MDYTACIAIEPEDKACIGDYENFVGDYEKIIGDHHTVIDTC